MLQVQEDGVLTDEVPQQLGHVGDTVRDDGQPLLARHVTPGQALGRGQARGCSVRGRQSPSFSGNRMRGGSHPEEQLLPPLSALAPTPVFSMPPRSSSFRAREEAVTCVCLEGPGMLRAGQVAFRFGGSMNVI